MTKELPKRKSLRLKNYDYSTTGYYFITILTDDRKNLFGSIKNEKIVLNDLGLIANNTWLSIPQHFSNITLDEYVIMPNHMHGIFLYSTDEEHKCEDKKIAKSIGTFLQSYKATVTRESRSNRLRQNVWQRNYYEHVIRNEDELSKTREYIKYNPLKWDLDRNNLESTRLVSNGSIY